MIRVHTTGHLVLVGQLLTWPQSIDLDPEEELLQWQRCGPIQLMRWRTVEVWLTDRWLLLAVVAVLLLQEDHIIYQIRSIESWREKLAMAIIRVAKQVRMARVLQNQMEAQMKVTTWTTGRNQELWMTTLLVKGFHISLLSTTTIKTNLSDPYLIQDPLKVRTKRKVLSEKKGQKS